MLLIHQGQEVSWKLAHCGAETPTESRKPTGRELAPVPCGQTVLSSLPIKMVLTVSALWGGVPMAMGTHARSRLHQEGRLASPLLPDSVAVSVKSSSLRGISLQFLMQGPVWGRLRDWGDEKQ